MAFQPKHMHIFHFLVQHARHSVTMVWQTTTNLCLKQCDGKSVIKQIIPSFTHANSFVPVPACKRVLNESRSQLVWDQAPSMKHFIFSQNRMSADITTENNVLRVSPRISITNQCFVEDIPVNCGECPGQHA